MKNAKQMRGAALVIGGLIIVAIAVAALVLRTDNTKNDVVIDIRMPQEERENREGQLQSTLNQIEELKSNREEISQDLYERLAFEYNALGRVSDTRRTYEELMKKYPEAAEEYVVLKNYAQSLKDEKNYEAAREAFQEVLTKFVWLESDVLSFVDLVKKENPNDPQIVRTLDFAISNYGQLPSYMTELAEWYTRDGQCALAAEHYEIIKDLDEEAEAWVKGRTEELARDCIEGEGTK